MVLATYVVEGETMRRKSKWRGKAPAGLTLMHTQVRGMFLPSPFSQESDREILTEIVNQYY
jgi:hypothetical protein